MTAPGGLCESCGGPLNWTFIDGELYTSCPLCVGMDLAGVDVHEGREAVMPDGRPIRCIERIVQDA